MDWAVSTSLLIFLSSLLSLLVEGTKLSKQVNRIFGLICLVAVITPLLSKIAEGSFIYSDEDTPVQYFFLDYLKTNKTEYVKDCIDEVLSDNGINDYQTNVLFDSENQQIEGIIIYLKRAIDVSKETIIDEISKKIGANKSIISICTE